MSDIITQITSTLTIYTDNAICLVLDLNITPLTNKATSPRRQLTEWFDKNKLQRII